MGSSPTTHSLTLYNGRLSTPTPAPPAEIATDSNQDNTNLMEANRMKLQIGDTILSATLAENSSVDALKAALGDGPITIKMRDYGSMEKVGPLGMD